MHLLLSQAPQLLPGASPQPVKIQSHKSQLPLQGLAALLPLHPLPISIPPNPKRQQMQTSGRGWGGGRESSEQGNSWVRGFPLLLQPSWVLTLSLGDLLRQLPVLEGLLGGP